MLHRRDGKIVPILDDLLSALRQCVMQIRSAKDMPSISAKLHGHAGPNDGLAAGLEFDLFG